MRATSLYILAVVLAALLGLFVLAGLGQVEGGALLDFTTHVLAVLLGVLVTVVKQNGRGVPSVPPRERKQ